MKMASWAPTNNLKTITATGSHKSAAAETLRFGGGGDGVFEFGQTDAMRLQAVGIGADFDLFHAAAHVENFGDAGDALETAFDGPIGERADVARRRLALSSSLQSSLRLSLSSSMLSEREARRRGMLSGGEEASAVHPAAALNKEGRDLPWANALCGCCVKTAPSSI